MGSPNFTRLPINAPRSPVANFQRDGHSETAVPTGRANYEPNSWGPAGGPREDPQRGYTTFPAQESGPKRRLRPESFADHYSQARQFFSSQTEIEQQHIAAAFTFELSKVEQPTIRVRMVAGLRNVDEDLAATVAAGLRLAELPDALPAARPTRHDLAPSPALSILRNPPADFAGRKLGVLVTDGADADVLKALQNTAAAAGVTVEIVAKAIAGARLSDGTMVEAQQKIDGAPSVLYDAVVVLASESGAAELTRLPAARDFVTDAYAHAKFIGHSPAVQALFEATGLDRHLDDGFRTVTDADSVGAFLVACRQLRRWDRQLASNG